MRKRGLLETKLKKIGTDFCTETIAYYGPDDKTVTKIVVGIIVGAGYNFIDTKKWSSESKDIKKSNSIPQYEEYFTVAK